MWSGWRRRGGPRRALGRAAQDLKGVRLPDFGRFAPAELKRLRIPDLHAPDIDWGRGRMSSRAAALWPALFAAAGTGAAVWWWNQWARGRAEHESALAREAGLAPVDPASGVSERDRSGGASGVAHPEEIMAHAPLDDATPADAPLGEDASAEPVETLAPHVKAALDESLAVQAGETSAAPPAAR